MVSKRTLAQISKKVCFLKINAKKKRLNYFAPPPLPQFLKVGRVISPSSFTHEVVLVKFELQTHMEHLSSCQSELLVVCASQSSVFWVFAIFCQPLNIWFFSCYTCIFISYIVIKWRLVDRGGGWEIINVRHNHCS